MKTKISKKRIKACEEIVEYIKDLIWSNVTLSNCYNKPITTFVIEKMIGKEQLTLNDFTDTIRTLLIIEILSDIIKEETLVYAETIYYEG
jgi:hypothetical protein